MDRLQRTAWLRRLGWLVAFWLAGVASLAVIAFILKFLMRAAGLSA